MKPPLFLKTLVTLNAIMVFVVIGVSLWKHEFTSMGIIAILLNLASVAFYQTHPYRGTK